MPLADLGQRIHRLRVCLEIRPRPQLYATHVILLEASFKFLRRDFPTTGPWTYYCKCEQPVGIFFDFICHKIVGLPLFFERNCRRCNGGINERSTDTVRVHAPYQIRGLVGRWMEL